MRGPVEGTKKNNSGTGRSRKWIIFLGIVGLLLLCLVLLTLSLDRIAQKQVNQFLTSHLAAGGNLDKVSISILAGRIELHDLTINPPQGHGDKPLLFVKNLVIDLVPTSLLEETVVIEEFTVNGLVGNLVRNKQGRVGFADLVISSGDRPTEATEQKPEGKIAADHPSDGDSLPVVRVDTIRLEEGTITIRDSALTGKPLVFPLKNMILQCDDLRLFAPDSSGPPATLEFSLEMEQPENRPAAYFGTLAQFGPVTGQGLPAINAQARLIGLKLDSLGDLIPLSTREALGADGLDGGISLALNNGRVNLDTEVVTDSNIRYDTIQVHGPLEAPVVNIDPVMSGVFRVTGGVLNLGEQGLGAGIRIAEGGINTVKEVGSGAWKVGKNLVASIFTTGVGLLTLDTEKIEEGLTGSVGGTVEGSMETVKGASRAAGSGIIESASELTGSSAIQRWEKETAARFQTAMQHARQSLAKMPYPPVTN